MCNTVFVGDRATVKFSIFTEKLPKKIKRKLAVALKYSKDRIFADFQARKAETDIGKLNII